MDDNNFQNSLCITSMKQKLSGPTEAHGPFISNLSGMWWFSCLLQFMQYPNILYMSKKIQLDYEITVFSSHIISRGAEGPGREILQRPPSVCLSVRPSVCPSRLVFAL